MNSPLLLFFDTETNSLPKFGNSSQSNNLLTGRIIDFGWILCDRDGKVLDDGNFLIKPDGWEIPRDDFYLDNGFDTEISSAKGIPLSPVLRKFSQAYNETDFIVGHNIGFDEKVVRAEARRYDIPLYHVPITLCTMKTSRYLVKALDKRCRIKLPTQAELYRFLFNRDIENAHHAYSDAKACYECFFELWRRGHYILNKIVSEDA